MPEFIDLTGKKFGRWTVIGPPVRKEPRREVFWPCVCECGEERVVSGSHLRGGFSKSCGCFARERSKECATKHGKYFTRVYSCYGIMKRRCYDKNLEHYPCYGGRGIKVCDEWLGEDGFQHFYDWAMTNGYEDGLTLDRIDVNGDYCPENCKWATWVEQANNKRNSHFIEYNGERHTYAQWERINGLKQGTISSRIRNWWSIEEALESQLWHRRRKNGGKKN